jgi:N utilization substance protein B
MFRIKYCREIILKLLYSADIQQEKITDCRKILEQYRNFWKPLNPEESEYIVKIVQRVFTDIDRIDRAIKDHLIGWELKRLTPVDRNLLRMGIAEMHENHEKAIIIDDIIRISKKYSEKDSYKIINAILDKVKL